MEKSWLPLALAFAMTPVSIQVMAQAYPSKPMRLITQFGPGSSGDTVVRTFAQPFSELLGQPVVVENQAGASGNLGMSTVAKAQPNGYTLGIASGTTHTIGPALKRKMPFDPIKDFTFISTMAKYISILTVRPSVPATNVKELIAHIKSRPGQMQFASAGVGSMPHLMMEFFVSMAGLKMNHVPYKGAGVALVDVIAGHVPLMAANILSTLPQVRAGKLRAYGVTSAKRSPGAPDIPAISESGLPGYDAVTWFGVLAPAGLPRDIVTRLHTNVVRAVNDAGVRKRFIDDGADPSPSASPEAFAALIRSEVRKWATVIKDAGIQPE